jgi:hypothetical protein
VPPLASGSFRAAATVAAPVGRSTTNAASHTISVPRQTGLASTPPTSARKATWSDSLTATRRSSASQPTDRALARFTKKPPRRVLVGAPGTTRSVRLSSSERQKTIASKSDRQYAAPASTAAGEL